MKISVKRVFAIVFICIFTFGIMLSFVACSSGESGKNEQGTTVKLHAFEPLNEIRDGRPNIFLIVRLLDSSYWQVIINGAREAGDSYECNVYYSGTDNETDWESQLGLLEKATEQGADGIIIAPNDSTRLSKKLRELHELDIPVALVDTVVNEDVFDVCYMTDNYIAGQNAAEEMLSKLKEMGHDRADTLKLGILVGSASSQTINERLAGFYQYWSEYAPAGWIIINDIKNCNGDIEYAGKLTQALINDNPDIAGLYGTNNGPTRALCSTVMNEGRTDIVVVGFDYSDEMKEMINLPEYTASTMLQRQYDMGYRAVFSLKSLIDGEEVQNRFEDTGVVTVNHESIVSPEVVEILDKY